ncbi:MAG: hypothetical protein P4M09_11470 [Devosia sp.]|nr:hypothetical protein [Devosia sp.]
MAATIFYSWQSDTPKTTGRNFIERALERAIGQLADDLELDEAVRELVIDRDTKGVPGSPKIVDTIFAKIDAAEAFVGDMTFVGRRPNDHPIPNPNVLIEYGWALKSLTHDRVVTVMNTAYGEPDPATLPFDMRHVRHPITFHLADGATTEEVQAVRTDLAKTLTVALRDILNIPKAPVAVPPLFQPRESGATPGRFRAAGEPLAHSEDPLSRAASSQVFLKDGPVTWLRLMPTTDPRRTWAFAELKAAATDSNTFMLPFCMGSGGAGIGYLRDADGFGTRVMLADSEETIWASFLFNTGEIWGNEAFSMQATDGLIYVDRPGLAEALHRYRSALTRLGINGPYRWRAGFEGAKGRALAPERGQSTFIRRGTALIDVIQAEGSLADDQDPGEAIKPLIAALYDACGLPPPA